jgi:3-oxoacid CoA-transferase B subunit
MTRESKKSFIARRVAQELKDGDFVNLGIGIPTMVANYVPDGVTVVLHSENGLLGIGEYPEQGQEDADLINAGKETVTEVVGCSYINSEESFAMARGGHLDLAVIGAMEVDEAGNLANWMIPGKMIKGMGGAMDLVSGSKRLIIAMQHVGPKGDAKILKRCRLPLTARGVVDMIVTDMAVMVRTPEGLVLTETAPDVTVEEVITATEASLIVDPALASTPQRS